MSNGKGVVGLRLQKKTSVDPDPKAMLREVEIHSPSECSTFVIRNTSHPTELLNLGNGGFHRRRAPQSGHF